MGSSLIADDPVGRAVSGVRRVNRDLVAVLLPLAACAVQWLLWPVFQPLVLILFYPTVFLSSAVGGVAGGLTATFVSALLVVYFFIPPQASFIVDNPLNLFSVAVFIGMGVLFTVTQERLRRAMRRSEDALTAAGVANERLSRANDEIARLLEKTRELDALKSQFFANVSHELRTPLTLILGPVERHLAAGGLEAGTRRDLEVVARNARLLHRHVDDLLDVARLEAGKAQLRYAREDLARLTRFVGSHFEVVAAERRIELEIDAPNAIPAEVDAEKCSRILFNLLSNAFKFTPDGGTIRLSAGVEPGLAVLRVADSGPGVPTDQREAIFEPFRQLDGGADRRQGGTGLGLAIVRQFAALHRGEVRVGEATRGGALFTVTLPLVAPPGSVVIAEPSRIDREDGFSIVEELLAPREPEIATPHGAPGLPLVLVVEDNPDMREYIAGILGGICRVATAGDGATGLAAARQLRPDLIVSDVMMPGVSGDRMVAQLRQLPEFADTPIVMLTAKIDEDLKVDLLRRGVSEYLGKPFRPAELLARVDGLMRERARSREEIRGSLERLSAHVENSPLAVVEFDSGMRITRWSCGAERVFGWTAGEVLGRRIEELRWVHGEDLERVGVINADMVAGRSRRSVVTNRNHHRDGSVLVCEWYNSVLFDEAGAFDSILSLALDVTAEHRAEVLLRTRLELSDRAHRGDEDGVLQRAVDVAEQLTQSTIGFFHFVDEESGSLTLQTWSTATLRSACTTAAHGKHYPVLDAGVWVDALRARAPVIHNDYAALSHRKGLPPGHAPVTRELVVPVFRGERIVAVLGVGNKPVDYVDADMNPLGELGSMAMDLVARILAERERGALYEQAREEALAKGRLLQEVNHRVKNNLIALRGLLLLEQRSAPAAGLPWVEPVLERLSGRIRGLLAAHELLSGSEWAPMPVAVLAERVLRGALAVGANQSAGIDVAPSGEYVSPRQAGNLALILNELAMNTVRHGGADAARAGVRAWVDGDFLAVEYRDNGSGYPEEVLRGGRWSTGLFLISELARGTLRGDVSLRNEGGAVATITIRTEEAGRT